MLILAVAIISVAVIAYAAAGAVNTKVLTQYVEDTYNDAYLLTVKTMQLKTILFYARETMHDVTENKNAAETEEGLQRLYANRAMLEDLLQSLGNRITEEDTRALKAYFDRFIELNDEIIALAGAGESEETYRPLMLEAEAVFFNLSRLLDRAIENGMQEIERYVVQSRELNEQINNARVLFFIVVIGVSLATGVVFARIISLRNKEIYRREMLFSVILENVDAVFIVHDGKSGEVQFASENAERILGIDFKPGMPRNSLQEKLGEDVYAKLKEIYENSFVKKVTEIEFELVHRQTGEILSLRSKVFPLFDKKNERIQFVSATQDITQDKLARQVLSEALRKAEHASVVKREFLSRASHELKTPINAILGMKAVAELAMGDAEKLENCMEKIDCAAKCLLRMVDEMLDVADMEMDQAEGERQPFNLDRLLENVSSCVHVREAGKKFFFHVEKEEGMQQNLIGNEAGIRRILLEFLANATKAAGEGGSVTLHVRQHDISEAAVFTRFTVRGSAGGKGDAAVFSASEADESIPENLGFSMSVCKTLASQMGGDITITSGENRAGEFIFDIKTDFAAPSGFQSRRERPIDQFDFSGKRILIVEDNEVNMEIANELMKAVGFTTELAYDGNEAVERFSNSPVYYYDIVLMDVRMPQMDGTSAARAIRALPREDAMRIPIVAMTASSSHESVNESIGNGMDAHVTKPVMPQKVMVVLEEQLKKYGRM